MGVERLFESNRAWAERMLREDPGFFLRLVDQQKPRYLWIGCSDSRVPSSQITDLLPGDIFVHRNVANLVHPTYVNLMSVLEYAVDVLRVEHVLLVGHYGCGGVRAAMAGRLPGLADFWLEPVRDLARQRRSELDLLPGREREDRLCEWNVLRQVEALAHSAVVRRAWERGQALSVHGWIYGVHDGLLRDLGLSLDAPPEG